MNPPPISDVRSPQGFKDRRTGLIAFGIIQIILGGLAALIIPLTIFGQIMAAKVTKEPPPAGQMIFTAVLYGIAAATLITLGIGSLRTLRWARALSLVISWSWLVMGVMSLGVMSVVMPQFFKAAQPPGQALPPGVRIGMLVGMFLFIGVMFVLVPGILTFFYQSRHVKATCESRDPIPRWTDSCPLPVLALSLWIAFTAFSLLMMPFSMKGILPVFGKLISGPVGVLCYLALAGLFGYAAWAIYRVRPVGWWIVVVGVCIGTASAFVTFRQIGLMELYRAMGYPQRQLDLMKQFPFMQGSGIAYFSLVGAIPMMGFLLFVKRYFRSEANVAAV